MICNAPESNQDFSRLLYNKGYGDDVRSFKLFTFSPIKGNYLIQDKRISFSDHISLEIRSVDPAIIKHLICDLKENSEVSIARNTLKVDNAF